MALPFTEAEFLGVFRDYNEAIWPFQVVAYALGTLVVLALATRWRWSTRAVFSVLGVLWLFAGLVYHLTFFVEVNTAATLFGILFVAQGIVFLVMAYLHEDALREFRWDVLGLAAAAMIVYAMVVYPILGHLAGHGYPEAPVFGVAPCPLTIFTLGVLLLVERDVSRWLVVIPVIWSFIGFFAAINLGIYEDVGLLVAGVTTGSLILLGTRLEEAGLVLATA
jgi:hypothetical protein